MRHIVSLHKPSPILQEPAKFNNLDKIGSNISERGKEEHYEIIDFFCCTPNMIKKSEFVGIMSKAKYSPYKFDYISEEFCAGYTPQMRIRAYF